MSLPVLCSHAYHTRLGNTTDRASNLGRALLTHLNPCECTCRQTASCSNQSVVNLKLKGECTWHHACWGFAGLDARAAAIVMRTVRNTVNTGRTVVCTIHQPSIDIFEVWFPSAGFVDWGPSHVYTQISQESVGSTCMTGNRKLQNVTAINCVCSSLVPGKFAAELALASMCCTHEAGCACCSACLPSNCGAAAKDFNVQHAAIACTMAATSMPCELSSHKKCKMLKGPIIHASAIPRTPLDLL